MSSMDNGSGSALDRIRARHHEIQEARTVDLDIDGYDGLLVSRYRLMDVRSEIAPLSKKMSRETRDITEQGILLMLDTISGSCMEIFVSSDGETLTPLAQSLGPEEPPVVYDSRLAEFLGVEAESSRDVIMQVFGGKELLMMQHGRKLVRWMSSGGMESSEDLLTELLT